MAGRLALRASDSYMTIVVESLSLVLTSIADTSSNVIGLATAMAFREEEKGISNSRG